MSIKNNIKEELLKRIEQREHLLKLFHNEDIELIANGSIYHEGHINANDDELIFLDKLKAFINSL